MAAAAVQLRQWRLLLPWRRQQGKDEETLLLLPAAGGGAAAAAAFAAAAAAFAAAFGAATAGGGKWGEAAALPAAITSKNWLVAGFVGCTASVVIMIDGNR